jgi:hypothetical protein
MNYQQAWIPPIDEACGSANIRESFNQFELVPDGIELTKIGSGSRESITQIGLEPPDLSLLFEWSLITQVEFWFIVSPIVLQAP